MASHDELILRFLKGETTEEENRELGEWRSASPDHERVFRQLARLWELRRVLDPVLHGEFVPTAEELLLVRPAQAAPAVRKSPRLVRRIGSWFQHVPRVAAVVAAVLVLAIGVRVASVRLRAGGEVPSLELVTDAGQSSSARLGDGTVVRLAPLSRLRVLSRADLREAWLEGRAFFAAAHDRRRPFVVHTAAGGVEVKGTRFDLESRSGSLRLVVVDGLVRVSSGGVEVDVAPGQVARVAPGEEPTVETVADVYALLGWIGEFIAFDSTPLRVVVEELERRWRSRVRILDSALAARPVSIWSTDKDPDEVLQVICLAVQAYCTVEDSVLIMAP